MNELLAGLMLAEWANQSLPRSKERSMSFVSVNPAEPRAVWLPAPKKAGEVKQILARAFVAVEGDDGLEWREKTWKILVDHNGEPIKPIESAIPQDMKESGLV